VGPAPLHEPFASLGLQKDTRHASQRTVRLLTAVGAACAPLRDDEERSFILIRGSTSLGVRPRRFDVVVVGGGIAGTAAAITLDRAGFQVALLDPLAVCPPDFRAEKLNGEQLKLLRRLDLYECLAMAASRFDRVLNVKRGRVTDATAGEILGIAYQDIVNALRRELRASVDFTVARVARIEAEAELQRVTVTNGDIYEARLVILATGRGDVLRRDLGVSREVIFEKHSVSFGFSLETPWVSRLRNHVFTFFSERTSDVVDYLSLFPMRDGAVRANLFTYHKPGDPWTRAFRANPKQMLLSSMPSIGPLMGEFEIAGEVDVGIMDLYVTNGFRRDGAVLIGDAFQTSNPAAGNGVTRLLTDVNQLCKVHAPRWLSTPGMNAAKISQFYDDPVKRASDERAMRVGQTHRSLVVGTSPSWVFRRYARHLRHGVRSLLAGNPGTLRSERS